MAVAISSALSTILQNIVILDDTNWPKWIKAMKIFFMGLDADFIVTGTAPAATETAKVALDKQMLPYIYGKVADEYQYLVEDADCATAAWTALKGQFEKSNMTNRMLARQDLLNVTHDPTKNIAVYFRDVTNAIARLNALGVTIGETEHKDILLLNLHPSFHPARGVILTNAKEPGLADVKSLLTASASADPSVNVKSEPIEMAMAARFNRAGGSSRSDKITIGGHGFPVDSDGHRWCDPTNSNCHRCGRSGHVAGKCMFSMPQGVKDWILKNASSSSANSAFAAALAAGLTPESFTSAYRQHVGVQSAQSAQFAGHTQILDDDSDSDDGLNWDGEQVVRYVSSDPSVALSADQVTEKTTVYLHI